MGDGARNKTVRSHPRRQIILSRSAETGGRSDYGIGGYWGGGCQTRLVCTRRPPSFSRTISTPQTRPPTTVNLRRVLNLHIQLASLTDAAPCGSYDLRRRRSFSILFFLDLVLHTLTLPLQTQDTEPALGRGGIHGAQNTQHNDTAQHSGNRASQGGTVPPVSRPT
jgi:hypothetical protein